MEESRSTEKIITSTSTREITFKTFALNPVQYKGKKGIKRRKKSHTSKFLFLGLTAIIVAALATNDYKKGEKLWNVLCVHRTMYQPLMVFSAN